MGHRRGVSGRQPRWRFNQDGFAKESAADSTLQVLPFCETGAAIEQVQNTDAWAETKLCFAFIALTASRSGEARFATWQEIDMDVATWTVPAVRMKNGLEHRVPLSKQAIDVLTEAQAWGMVADWCSLHPRGKP